MKKAAHAKDTSTATGSSEQSDTLASASQSTSSRSPSTVPTRVNTDAASEPEENRQMKADSKKSETGSNKAQGKEKQKPQRISGYDFRTWDKLDVVR